MFLSSFPPSLPPSPCSCPDLSTLPSCILFSCGHASCKNSPFSSLSFPLSLPQVLSTFLNELDGVDVAAGQEGVLVVGATNLPEVGREGRREGK